MEDTAFDRAQITFALKPHRLLYIDRPNCWLEFFANQENRAKYYEYSAESLCERFLNLVLVRIYNYDLNYEECHTLKLLELQPNFKRTENGFIKITELEKIDFSRGDVTLMDGAGDDLDCQVVLTPIDAERSKFQLSDENAALLSVTLSSDVELATCERVTDVLKRMREAKRLFEQTGRQLENVNISIDGLLKKLNTVEDLKNVLVNLVRKSFYK